MRNPDPNLYPDCTAGRYSQSDAQGECIACPTGRSRFNMDPSPNSDTDLTPNFNPSPEHEPNPSANLHLHLHLNSYPNYNPDTIAFTLGRTLTMIHS